MGRVSKEYIRSLAEANNADEDELRLALESEILGCELAARIYQTGRRWCECEPSEDEELGMVYLRELPQ